MNKVLTIMGLLLVVFGIYVMVLTELEFFENLPTWSRIVMGILIMDVGALMIPKIRTKFKMSDKLANYLIVIWLGLIVSIYVVLGV